MKKITLHLSISVFLMAIMSSFGQATGPSSSIEEFPVGIQNKSGSENQNDISVLIAAAPGTSTWADDVEAKIESEGFADADIFLTNQGTPTLAELQSYDAVFVFTDAGVSDSEGFGNILAAYLEDGGAVVDATFTPNVSIDGDWTQYELYSDSGQSGGANLGIGTISDPSDPLLTNVVNFDGGTASFHNTGGTIASNAVVVAEYTTGAPLIIKQENVGPENVRRVFLNFYPPSIDVRADFWNTASDGATIMSNAIQWVVSGQVLSVASNTLTTASMFPNPATNEITIVSSEAAVILQINIIDVMGRTVKTEEVNATSKTMDISNLTPGVYFAQISQGNTKGSIKFIKR